MSRADFYILAAPDEDSRQHFLCRLSEKILAMGLKVFVRVPDETGAARLDERLWSWRPDSFVPHALMGQTPEAPITIGWGDALPEHREVFVNLGLNLPAEALDFQRIVEIVVQQQDLLDASRHNWRLCQQHGLEMHRTDMRG
ncbi:DNA polymerase III subunit chi [Marinobacterium nitratireducens]|uniref:DNA polymerase III subunit chi n=1 Tax=Marinobacterium nitratireducens TaxID=518897 RepID=A0A917ZM09_9GAMM|nr:DNA polymerase III subunit chi [Marinobacterium nitratireducens]GGO86197.1 DNA polymerase III subunit chi [Marinobacterium nitratireducens]